MTGDAVGDNVTASAWPSTVEQLTDEWMGVSCLSSPVRSTSCYSSVHDVKATEMG